MQSHEVGKCDNAWIAMPHQTALWNNGLFQACVLSGFLGFQALDAVTTHLGLVLNHPELNRLMGSVIGLRGELIAYAMKGIGVAMLLSILMLLQQRRPGIWHAYRLAGWISAVAVIVNVYHLMA